VNGHQFVQAAFDNGAVLALIDQELPPPLNTFDLRPGYFNTKEMGLKLPMCLRVKDVLSALHTFATAWRRKHPIPTIGITGSVGKTSTKELTASLLAEKFTVLKNPGNRNNEIGLPITLLALEPSHEFAVLEMGFYVPGEIRTLCEIAHPQIGVVTNIGTVHAERAGSQEIIAKGKAELIESLPSAPEGIAILNKDDERVWNMRHNTQAQIFSYAISNNADLTASEITTHGLEGLSCTLTYQGKNHTIHSPLMGAFSAYTILCASAVALIAGLGWDQIEAGLAKSQIDIRMQQNILSNGVIVLDDTYNASPASTIAALDLLKGLEGRRVAILGDMLELGVYERSGHESVGEAAAKAADVLILVGMRSKSTAKAAILQGFPEKNIHWYPDSNQAAELASKTVQQGDIVLIKGSNSMQMSKIAAALEEQV